MTEKPLKREMPNFCAIVHMNTFIRDHMCTVASKLRLVCLRAKIGCLTFLVYKQLQ